LQLNLPLIVDDDHLKEDLYTLPKDALTLLFSQTETCISDFRLFRLLEERLLFMKGKTSVEQVN